MNVLPTIVFADFETAIYNPVTIVWPGLEVKSCRFHLRQSWWRKIQSLELSKHYGKKDSEVCDCFALEFLSNLPNDKRVDQFCNYLLYNFIDAYSTFPLPLWYECTASSLRTTNACVSFHALSNALFYSAHHNICILVSALQKNTE